MSAPRKKSTSKKKSTRRIPSASGVIEVRGARQNNLKGFDIDIPLGKLNVVTGPSGSGKSSFAFQTVYAEGQRRYVETFSPYTRQFFDRMDKPQVDAIRGIPPAIAIEQANNVRSTRSTVGTITEINDYLKLLFPQVATAICPECAAPIQPETPKSIAARALEAFDGRVILVTFGIPVPAKTKPTDFFSFLQAQGYLRIFVYNEIHRVDEPDSYRRKTLPAVVRVVQDRMKIAAQKSAQNRLYESIEAALHFGKGQLALIPEGLPAEALAFSTKWHCAACDIDIRPPSPGLFSFNNPLGACPTCRGFGRTIGIDIDRALPDKSLSIRDGLVKAFQGNTYSESQQDLLRCARTKDIDLDCAFEDLPKSDQDWVLFGEGNKPEEAWESREWYGVQGFFDWLESKSYKMHVRVFLSRYRSYTRCRVCRGQRLQPEALNYVFAGKKLPELWHLSIGDLLAFLSDNLMPSNKTTETLAREITARLRYLTHVGLTYLNLDRPTRSLSGGEVQRVNLTTCLGASLVNTLFVLDEPSIGLHPRDTGRLIEVMESLRDKGNTLLVVEHEESVIRASDNLIDIGPGRGEKGGALIYHGPSSGKAKDSLTLSYLRGEMEIPVPKKRRKAKRGHVLTIHRATQNNLKKIDAIVPLGLFTCVTGVSGSGKSTLVHDVLYQNLMRLRGEVPTEEPGACLGLSGYESIGQCVMVDQSPLARTPRSTPAVFTGAFDHIRKLFANTPDAKAQGLTPGFFSFNSGAGRCERCWGNGFEKIEMQFLSDLYLRCPECEGKRYTPDALALKLEDKSIHDVLELTVDEAIAYFQIVSDRFEGKKPTDALAILTKLETLSSVGLTYLRLGQPLNTLSGGESQRLKLVGHLLESPNQDKPGASNLLIFDEPTTGLHFDDIRILLDVFHRLADAGHTLIVIEHNLDVIKNADHVIDLGPEAGDIGGYVVATGTPEEIAEVPQSHTGRFLRSPSSEEESLRAAEEATPYVAEKRKPKADNSIRILGAREHNLKNIDIEIPRDELVVLTGLSGSGKSTLAFDILFAEGQRRFLDSMSTYARQFVEQMEKPEIDSISGLPPTVAIEQRISRGGGKSTVATVTEVYHFLRLLWAKTGTQHCPKCNVPVEKQSLTHIVATVRAALKRGPVQLLAPVIKARKGFHTDVAVWAEKHGYAMLFVDGQFKPSANFKKLERFKEHSIDVVVAIIEPEIGMKPLQEVIERALRIGKGTARLLDASKHFQALSSEMSCPTCGEAFEELDPRLFSYNSPHGWCSECRGYGFHTRAVAGLDTQHADSIQAAELEEEMRMSRVEETEKVPCAACSGARLNETARHVLVNGLAMEHLAGLSVGHARAVVEDFDFSGSQKIIARDILPEISQRLRFMEEVGLGYLQLDRAATTLSGGESQRIRLAAQLGSNLTGVLYVLDEPTIGLHPRDNEKLLDTLVALRDHGNSVIIVEHDEETMRRANHVIDLGPGAGKFGGEVTYAGTSKALFGKMNVPGSPTAMALGDPIRHPMRGERRKLPSKTAKSGWLVMKGASANNLKNIDVRIPVGRLTGITGISGSGKSSLMRGVLKPAIGAALAKKRDKAVATNLKSLVGADQFAAAYEVDQSPIGKTSRSTPATYVKVFDEIRKLFAVVPEARIRGYTASRFSFNNDGGRCETCGGNGLIKLEMNFLPTGYVECENCLGLRYNAATLEIEYNDKNIGQVMAMTIDEATDFFAAHPKIHRTLKLLRDTGLGYLQLGQPSPTLSGGEAQRIKLVTQLTKGVARAQNARLRQNRTPLSNLYLIEEPTIGLHMSDVRKLLEVLHALVDDGHTVVVIEHNLDLIAEADYLIDIGPEAGAEGGQLVAAGTPEEVAKSKVSRTAPFLRAALRS
jgi:excinuclease ABC subunit A